MAKTEITPDKIADVAVSGLSGKATSLITSFLTSIPLFGGIIGFLINMFDIDKAIQSSPLVAQLETDARNSIIQAGKDKNSPVGQGIQLFNETVATADSKIKDALGVVPDQSAENARLAAAKAKPPTPIEGGEPATASPAQTTPQSPSQPAAGIQK